MTGLRGNYRRPRLRHNYKYLGGLPGGLMSTFLRKLIEGSSDRRRLFSAAALFLIMFTLVSGCRTSTNKELTLKKASEEEIQLELIRRQNWNEFYGQAIYDDLVWNHDLWNGILMVSSIPLTTLRDMPDNYWNVDTLYIWAKDEASVEDIMELGWQWKADARYLLTAEEASELMGSSEKYFVIRMWWD